MLRYGSAQWEHKSLTINVCAPQAMDQLASRLRKMRASVKTFKQEAFLSLSPQLINCYRNLAPRWLTEVPPLCGWRGGGCRRTLKPARRREPLERVGERCRSRLGLNIQGTTSVRLA